jgi:YidC/Oxa1 family membrane protein insertase
VEIFEPVFGPLLKGFGATLAFLYSLVPSYGLAIILVTVLVRILLIPLTIRQTRSMHEMQKLQPKLKELQRKYKGNRQKLNEEMMKLYKEHQVNPLGGCLPLVLQIPVFIALFAVLRATEGAFGIPAEPVPLPEVTAARTICLPNTAPSVSGERATAVVCRQPGEEPVTYDVAQWETKNTRREIAAPPPSIAVCPRPEESNEEEGEVAGFLCESVLGPGHLPEDTELFAAIVEDRAEFLGIELACSPAQAASQDQIRLCAGPGTRGGIVYALPYFLLVALMVGTTFYQQRQMQRAAAGPVQQQQQLMTRIMPIFLGVLSYTISAGVLVYWVTTNAWQIGQQYLMLRSRSTDQPATGDGAAKKAATGKGTGPKGPASKGSQTDGQKRDARSRKKRRKR